MSITIRVIRVPGATKELVLPDNTTVEDALQAAGTSVSSDEALQVNGANTTMDTILTDGARVTIAKGAKGA
jgi:sulfur carrier protein ThiS